jgi:hypothetical protein
VAHNDTVRTRRSSELYLLDGSGGVIERVPMGGSCCHNVGVVAGRLVTRRSLEGCVVVDGREVLAGQGFLRGLGIGPDYFVIGRSACQGDRRARQLGEGGVIITGTDFSPLASIRLTGTTVHDVRRVDVADLGLSMTPRPDLDGLTIESLTRIQAPHPVQATQPDGVAEQALSRA